MKRNDRWRRRCEFAALAVGVLGSIITIGQQAAKPWPGSTLIWRYWCVSLTILLGILWALLLLRMAAWIRRPQSRRGSVATRRLGGTAVTVAAMASLRMPRSMGALLVASTLGTVLLVTWCAGWITAWKRALPLRTFEAVHKGLELCGRSTQRRYRSVIDGIESPRPPTERAVSSRLTPKGAATTGALLIILVWISGSLTGAVVLGATVAAFEPTRPHDPRPSQVERKPATQGSNDPGPTVSKTTTTTKRTAALRCDYRTGIGPDVPWSVETAVAMVVREARKTFLICPTGPMEWRKPAQVYQQPIFTYDGEGAVLVAWRDRDAWIATFVSSDDAAAYRLVSAVLDWNLLGKPLQYRPCHGLWVQPFVDHQDRLVGVGVRARADEELRADQPLYVWGSTVETLLRQGDRILRLPLGEPAADVLGLVQYFSGDVVIRGPHQSAENLTGKALAQICS